MQLSDKQMVVQKFFEEFECKVVRLQELYSESFRDEAFTLCLVYIDRLASGHYGGDDGQNKRNFCRALKELSGNPIFGMIHPRVLLEEVRAKCFSATSLIQSIAERRPGTLLEEEGLAQEIGGSSLTDSQKKEMISNLWRASIASICYASVRSAEVHGPGSGGLDFDSSFYEGKKGVRLDFDTFYGALRKIFGRIKAISAESGQWFGNPNYLRRTLKPY